MNKRPTGDLLGQRFKVERHLGSGSFGNTYACVDSQTGTPVAVKELDMSHVDDWKAIDLFQREAETLERLDHPNIPDYVDFIPAESDDSAYLAQELAPGSTLTTLLRAQGQFSEARARSVATQMLDILVYLDACRPPVIHRDIKPDNILVDSADQLYLVDFGAVADVARQASKRGSTVAGTFGYMAPEQLHGSATVASDLYALGMTLIHLVTARPPEELPKARMKVQFREAAPQLSPHFATFIERLSEPVVEDRFQRAEQALGFLSNPAPKPSQPQRSSTRFERAAAHPHYEKILEHDPEVPNMVGLFAAILAAAALPLAAVPVFLAFVFPEISWLIVPPFLAFILMGVAGLVLYHRSYSNQSIQPLLVIVRNTERRDGMTFPMEATIEAQDGSRGRYDCYRVAADRMLSPGDIGVGFLHGGNLIDFIKINV